MQNLINILLVSSFRLCINEPVCVSTQTLLINKGLIIQRAGNDALTVERHPAAPHGLADQVRRADLGLLRHHHNVLPLAALVGLLDGVDHAQRVQTVLEGGRHRQRPPVPRPPVVLVLERLPHRLSKTKRRSSVMKKVQNHRF